MSSEKPEPDQSTTPAPKGTIGYEQASQPAKGRQATVGYGNAMWSFKKPSQPAMAAVQPPTPPPAPAIEADPTPPAPALPEARVIATAQTLAADSKDTFDFMSRAPAAAPKSKDTFDFMTQVSPNAPTMLADSSVVDAVSVAEAPTLGSDSLGLSSNGLFGGTTRVTSTASMDRRSTVLPSVEIVKGVPRLVHDDRLRYEHISQLGEGGMGEVLKTIDNDIGRTVAVKRLKSDMKAAPVLVRFMEEIRTIGQLEHPNIVPIHDVGVDERGEYYFVMKYVDGETLESIIEKLVAGDPQYHARYPFERRMQIFEGILEAIRYAHARGIIHRDIKPANIMVGPYGEVMVMDWGISKRIRADASKPDPRETFPKTPDGDVLSTQATRSDLFKTREGALVGTPAYMSPEQARGETLDERSDIYSLCVVLFEFLSLHHYLEDKQTLDAMIEGVKSHPAPFMVMVKSPHQAPTPGDLAHFVKKGLRKNPAERYQSIGEMIDRLNRRKEGFIPIQCQITFALQLTNLWRRFVVRHPTLLTLAMAAAVLLVIGLSTWSALR